MARKSIIILSSQLMLDLFCHMNPLWGLTNETSHEVQPRGRYKTDQTYAGQETWRNEKAKDQ